MHTSISCVAISNHNARRVDNRYVGGIPVTTATAERSFSALRLLKTYLRATMKEERLNGLALMAIRKDIQFKHDEVLDQYASEPNRCFKFD